MSEQPKRIGEGKAGPGRPKGSPNKVTAVLKDAILQAATEAGDGDLVAYLKRQAGENPVAFMTLLGKVLPLQVEGTHLVTYEVSDEPLTEDQWAATYAGEMH
ncbi:hypothetical protein [Devosia sp. CN2-171]|uniref:hypothetical protein n=1 Tax=Devosia sp. CN2-171 TaxID=3400909 RepID=UPI003BF84B38